MALDAAVVSGILAALGGGLLVGIERERSQVGPHTIAGVRTYTLAALIGGIGAMLEPVGLALAGLMIGVLVLVSYQTSRKEDPGLTGELALIAVFLLGALAMRAPQLAAALFVLVALLLASKQALHRFTRQVLSDAELTDLLLLAASVAIVLPLLPDRTMGPLDVLNPRKLWLLVVLVMGINAAGYIALRAFGGNRGMLLAGLIGGFVSSTATIGGMGQRARSMPALRRSAVAAALLSNVATVIQLALILAVLAPPLLRAFAPPLLAAGTAAAAIALAMAWHARSEAGKTLPEFSLARPFELVHALVFGAIVAAALLAAAALGNWIGESGVLAAAAASGIADVHAAAVTVGELAATGAIATREASLALALAFITNSIMKCLAALGSGGGQFARLIFVGVVVIDAALLAAWVLVR